MRKKHKSWEKYYNRRRRNVHIKVNDLVLIQTHFLIAAGRKQVEKFMPKFEGSYRVLEVKGNNLIIWKSGKRVTVNIDQVRVYRPRQTRLVRIVRKKLCMMSKELAIGRIDRIKGSLKSTGKPLVRNVRGVDHGKVTPHGRSPETNAK
ncbi:uncharacterized protein TNCV_4571601 [Trichonephila clavipes]|nr:uncharacterized protein TNCV_4571601 [Trichonephila clavipes]